MSTTINWQNVLPYDGSEVANVCLKQLRDFFAGKLSAAEFEKENNYVCIGYPSVLAGFKVKNSPGVPAKYQEMLDLKSKRPKEFDSAQFIKDHPEVSDYMARLGSATHQNRSNALRLEELYEFFSTLGDLPSAMKIRTLYDEYPRSIYHGNTCIWEKQKL